VSSAADRDDDLHVENVPLTRVAEKFGTPSFVYSRAALTAAFHTYDNAFGDRPHLICYAAKANSNLAILDVLARLGSGFDIVSGGELKRVLAAGGDPRKIVFSGVGKSESELHDALAADILCFNVESESELMRLQRVAAGMGCTAPVSLRVNPDVDARTHPYISTGLRQNKFGVGFEDALRLFRRAHEAQNLKVCGIDCHIGSQLTELAPLADAARKVVELVDQLASLHGGISANCGPVCAHARRHRRSASPDNTDRTGSFTGGQCRIAAYTGGVSEARRGKELRGGRRRYE